ncbi:MAG: outer membrane beta-barrel protein [Planctomycetota bacterium]
MRRLAILILAAIAAAASAVADEPELLRPVGYVEQAVHQGVENHQAAPLHRANAVQEEGVMACPHCSGAPGACGCGDPVVGLPFAGGEKSPYKHWLIDQLMLRHSGTHGRAMGPGTPLRGTSWLNRPFSLGLELGGMLVTANPAENVRSNNDVLLAGSLGWDWDHYWGTQLRVTWSTPDFINSLQPTLPASDNLFIGDLSMLYYPWGDSRVRPYYRVGLGLTDIEYTQDDGFRRQDTLFTIPIGVGLKYQMRRWLVWRTELADNYAFGQNGTSDLHNLTLSTGIEWRFGGRRPDSWGWANRNQVW